MPNISKSKNNRPVKFGQLIEYNMKYFSQKIIHKQDMLEKLVPDHFSKESRLRASLDQRSEIFCPFFFCVSMVRTTRIFWNYGTNHLSLRHIKLKKKQKKSRTSLLASVYAWFLKKRIFYVRPTSKDYFWSEGY